MSKHDVKGKEAAITGLNIYLEYVVRSEINNMLQENPDLAVSAEELGARVGKRMADDYKQYGPGIMRSIGTAIKERLQK